MKLLGELWTNARQLEEFSVYRKHGRVLDRFFQKELQ